MRFGLAAQGFWDSPTKDEKQKWSLEPKDTVSRTICPELTAEGHLIRTFVDFFKHNLVFRREIPLYFLVGSKIRTVFFPACFAE